MVTTHQAGGKQTCICEFIRTRHCEFIRRRQAQRNPKKSLNPKQSQSFLQIECENDDVIVKVVVVVFCNKTR